MKRRLKPQVKKTFAAISVLSAAIIPFTLKEDIAEKLEIPVSSTAEYFSENESKLEEWQEINQKVRYLLEFNDEEGLRSIPVIETADVQYAMKHNVYGQYDSMGSVFCDVTAEENENTVIYGHSSKTKDWCFTFLKKYEDTGYYCEHPEFYLKDRYGTSVCMVVSLCKYDLLNDETYLGWCEASFENRDSVNEMFRNTIPYAINKTQGLVYHSTGIITLVTCDMDEADSRYVLQAIRTGGNA